MTQVFSCKKFVYSQMSMCKVKPLLTAYAQNQSNGAG